MSGIVRLERAFLPGCLDLSIEAGWNQAARDWDFIFTEGEVFGLRRAERLIACAAILPYPPRFAWICMMLVTAAERRKGHARALIRHCLDRLRSRSLIAGLDATPEGKEVYRKLGFEEIYTITRWARASGEPTASDERGRTTEPLEPHLLPAVAEYDKPRFGGRRGELLASLRNGAPHLAHVARRGEKIRGFVLGREGRSATQIGPAVAEDLGLARELLSSALSRIAGPCIIDMPDHHVGLRSWLEISGFEPRRSFSRMLFETAVPIDDKTAIMAITGPEFA